MNSTASSLEPRIAPASVFNYIDVDGGGAGEESGGVFAGDPSPAASSNASLGPVTIGGSVLGGSSTGSALVSDADAVFAQRIASVTVGGSLRAGYATADIAIASVTIGGRVELGKVRAGFTNGNNDFIGTNGNASIGPLKVAPSPP
jgi:hypothetical protein